MASYQAYGQRPSNTPSPAPYSNPFSNSYPPAGAQAPYSFPNLSRSRGDSFNSDDDLHDADPYKKPSDVEGAIRDITRTPSPTPSEAEELKKTSVIDWKAMMHWRYWIRREWAWYYVLVAIGLVLTILFTVYHDQIVRWLQPAATWMKDLKGGWLIPIAIMFVLSFPPLFGHEIIAILCGVVWGLWIGFGIVAAGTIIGELGNFYAFKYWCTARGEKLERTKLQYACLARIVREGGFKIALIARFSAIPGHFTTAVFATCGMNVLTFLTAAILSTPKQFMTVYLGVAFEQSENGGSGKTDSLVKDVVLGITVVVTFVAMWYIYSLMNKAKPAVIYDRRKARQAKLLAQSTHSTPYNNPAVLQSTASLSFNPGASEAEIPLTASQDTGRNSFNPTDSGFQRWDADGHAVGHAGDPMLHVPVPQHAPSRPFAEAVTHRPQQARTDTSRSAYSTTRTDTSGSAYSTTEHAHSRQTTVQSVVEPLPNPFTTRQQPQLQPQPQPQSRPSSRPTYISSPPPIPPPPQAPGMTSQTRQQSMPQSAPAPSMEPSQFAAYQPGSYGISAVPATAPIQHTTFTPPVYSPHTHTQSLQGSEMFPPPQQQRQQSQTTYQAHAYQPYNQGYQQPYQLPIQQSHAQAYVPQQPLSNIYGSAASVQSHAGSLPPSYTSHEDLR